MLTPQGIQDLADPIESVYIHMTDQLMVNIGRHLTSPTWTHTAAWEIQKLAEMGQLTEENAAIINAWIKQMPQEIRDTMEATRRAALEQLEAQFSQAVEEGFLPPPATDSTIQVMQDYAAQAADALNLVNTTMLQSSLDQYAKAVELTAQDVARAEATQTILNEAAGNVATGVETRRAALRRAIGQIAEEGLTGFIDRAGRSWSPEAYVNMDIRTTVHNTAIQATKARMEDFGTDVFQVSSHAGARPLCYPFQGKFYSWGNRYGEIELGSGAVVSYEPLNVTSYGEPAGLFGINCGHYPIPIIPGVTIPHGADNIQPEEENAKAYAESQEQRRLEREIREKKRVVEMAGDAATPEDKIAVREAQAQMREFINRTGRTRRYDREQIGGTPTSPTMPRQPSDVTENYTRRAKPGSGSLTIPAGYDKGRHTAEIQAATWLHDTFGGDISLTIESRENGEKTADYLWNNRLWELKNPTTEKATDQAIRKALKQIRGNAGGIILDYGNNAVSTERVTEIITNRMRSSVNRTVDVMIVKEGEPPIILRYRK